MNKFEALKQFQAWPPEWQRLCAEYWIESVQAKTSARLKQIKAAKVAAVKKRKHHSKQAWSAAESEYLLKLASENHPMWLVVDCFLEKYPGRSSDAIRRRTWGIRSGKPESEVKY